MPPGARARSGGISFDEAIARIREIVRYGGPVISIEDMNVAMRQMWAQGGPRGW